MLLLISKISKFVFIKPIKMQTNLSNWRPAQRGFLKTCPVCEDEFIGRKNKHFCSLACKNRHHNDRNAEARLEERAISRSLISNVRVLNKLFEVHPDVKSLRVGLTRMKELGFDFEGPVTEIASKGKSWFKVGKDHAYRVDSEQQKVIISKIN